MKTKHQKQIEAIQRKRLALPRAQQFYTEALAELNDAQNAASRKGLPEHTKRMLEGNVDTCRERAVAATARLARLAAEAECDIHGNPLPTSRV